MKFLKIWITYDHFPEFWKVHVKCNLINRTGRGTQIIGRVGHEVREFVARYGGDWIWNDKLLGGWST